MDWFCANCMKPTTLRRDGTCWKCASNAIAPADRAVRPDNDQEILRDIAERFYVKVE